MSKNSPSPFEYSSGSPDSLSFSESTKSQEVSIGTHFPSQTWPNNGCIKYLKSYQSIKQTCLHDSRFFVYTRLHVCVIRHKDLSDQCVQTGLQVGFVRSCCCRRRQHDAMAFDCNENSSYSYKYPSHGI